LLLQAATQSGEKAQERAPDEKGITDWAHLKCSEMLHGPDDTWKVGAHLPRLPT